MLVVINRNTLLMVNLLVGSEFMEAVQYPRRHGSTESIILLAIWRINNEFEFLRYSNRTVSGDIDAQKDRLNG